MNIALITANCNFLQPIYNALHELHEVKQFMYSNIPALNYSGMIELMNWADVTFFDFAQSPLTEMSHLAVKPCKIVTRVLGIEVYHSVTQINWQNVDHVIVISEHQKERLLEQVDLLDTPVDVIPLGINVDAFTMPEDKEFGYNICQVGNMLPHKRHYELIQLFAELILKSPLHHKWHLHLHHSTPGTWRKEQQKEYTAFCKDLVETLQIDDRVTFHPYDANWQQGGGGAFFADKDIIVSNSMMEGYHKTPLEGMACGLLPIVNCWRGSDMIYPQQFVFKTFDEAVHLFKWWAELSTTAKLSFARAHRNYVLKNHNEALHALRVRDILQTQASKVEEEKQWQRSP